MKDLRILYIVCNGFVAILTKIRNQNWQIFLQKIGRTKIERSVYMQQLIDLKDNGLIKVVTGLRRMKLRSDDNSMMGLYEFLADAKMLDA